ncbi:DUF885 domain-containing protein [Sphingomonas cavernae]|uniref:DUF885 domain-containing protein n=1 Tax=Sphingomonas cavernae TaxID=2320861 RepID=A0A418W746_9SPHN|nr:DUF885 family protein [Sphingomonas cavernae]RJF85851.1 DUF885 domain-containing protein [Sphingomonas cavernae]
MRTATLALALAAGLIHAPALADTLDAVVKDYEALANPAEAETGWPDISPRAVKARNAAYRALEKRLAGLDGQALTPEQALTRTLLDWRLDIMIEGARFDEERIPFDAGDGFFNAANYAAGNTVVRTEADARAWIARLGELPGWYDAQIANMRRGIATGFTQPRPTAEGVLAILKMAVAQPIDESPLLKPLAAMPPGIPADRRAALIAEGRAVVAQAVKPAQGTLLVFFEREYLPAARNTLGASGLPGGKAYYAYTARRSTTTDMTPDQIFALGEAEVKRIRAEMETAMRATGFTGSFAEFLAYVRSDPKFYAPDLKTYIEKAAAIGKRLDYALPRWFGKLPRLPWGIYVKPPEMEASSGAYYLGDPEKGVAGAVAVGRASYRDPLFGLTAWMMHEGVPGHHLQIALGQERQDLPAFRRRDDITAFVEGWALYSEKLGVEMGMYETPYDDFGRLSFEMWRACRLVMDVGIHWKGWSADAAERCLRENTALPESVAKGETQRYIGWPAQALAYKVGEVRFTALRRRAQAALGEGFDNRAFHDLLIADGPMPLSIVEHRVDAWLADGRASPAG